MQQQKGRVEPSGGNTGTSKDNVPKNNFIAASRKCGFHSGIKFIGNTRKSTQMKPFSFDAGPKSEKVTAANETEVKPLCSDSRRKTEKVLNGRKTEIKPLCSDPCSNSKKVEDSKEMHLKPLYFELCPDADEAICMHEDGRSCALLLAEAFSPSESEIPQSSSKLEKTASRKYGFHSGIKFIGKKKKSTQMKPFSFDARPKSEKVSAANETEVKPLCSDSRPKSEKVLIAKTEIRPLGSDPCPNSKKVESSKEMHLKPLYFELCPDADEVEHPEATVITPPSFEAPKKPTKVEHPEATVITPPSFEAPKKNTKIQKTDATEVKQLGSRIPQKIKEVMDPKETLLEAIPSSSDAQPQEGKGPRRNYRAHSGLKFIPRKKGTVVKPFSFESRSSTLKPKPGSTAQDV